MTREPVPLIDAIATAPDDAAQARLLRNGARDLLVDPAAIPDIAAIALEAADDAETQAAAALLSSALDEARMARENDAPEGAGRGPALRAGPAPASRAGLRACGPCAAGIRHADR